jgi:shikimate dehydrogenase
MAVWQELRARPEAQVRIAVVGHQVDLSLYPLVMTAGFESAGIASQVVMLDVPKTDFDACIHHLDELGFRGISVANPYKVDAARIAERFWVARFSLGTANALMMENGIFAQNTEVPAIMAILENLAPTTALIMGTGHAARSVAGALYQCGWKVRVWNRNANKTRVMQTLFKRFGELEMAPNPDPSGCKLIVNATPLGAKAGEQPPLMWARVQPKTVCFDLVFRRVPTEFLRTATMRGLKAIDGRELFVEQCGLAMDWWAGRKIDRAPMRAIIGLRGA